MKRQQEKSSKKTWRLFLGELGEPLPRQQIESATARVLQSLEAGEPERLSPTLVVAAEPRLTVSWKGITVAAVVLLIAAALQLPLFQTVADDVVARNMNGRRYHQGESVRGGSDANLLVLADGSRLELGPDAVVSIVRGDDGLRVHLSEGQLIVTAQKQRHGHLYVETKDCVVSVVGTVFSVNASASGSRVSVVEGEVQVRHGETIQTLLPGQQISTDLVAKPVSVKTDIEWSRDAPQLVALLQVAATPVQVPVPIDQTGTVRGTITRQGTAEPLRDVTLNICQDLQPEITPTTDGRVILRVGFALSIDATQCATRVAATTDETGQFLIKDVEPGRYVIRGHKTGYVAAFDATVPASGLRVTLRPLENWSLEGGPTIATRSILMENDRRPVDVKLSLVRPGTLAGKVRDEDGKKLAPYVPVQLVTPPRGNPPVVTVLAGVNTNSFGEYRFRVPPGEYVIFAGSIPSKTNSAIQEIASPLSNVDSLRVVVMEDEAVAASDLVFRDPQPQR